MNRLKNAFRSSVRNALRRLKVLWLFDCTKIAATVFLVFAIWTSLGFFSGNADMLVLALTNLNKALGFVVAAGSMMLVTGYHDYRGGVSQDEIYSLVSSDADAAARYFGARVLAYALLASAIYL